jgi:hypothetical protein
MGLSSLNWTEYKGHDDGHTVEWAKYRVWLWGDIYCARCTDGWKADNFRGKDALKEAIEIHTQQAHSST